MQHERRRRYEVGGECECVAAVPDAADGRIITASRNELKVWLQRVGDARDGECVHTFRDASANAIQPGAPITIDKLAILPGAPPRIISVSIDSVKLWAFEGAIESELSFGPGDGYPSSVAVLPDGMHFVLGLIALTTTRTATRA